MIDLIKEELLEARLVLDRFLSDENNLQKIDDAAEAMVAAINNGHKIISCGNGGSMCDAMHFAEELTGRYRGNRPSIPAIAVSDPGYLTCTGNDFGFDHIFSRFVEGVGQAGDVLLGISTSGNSQNVINAVEVAGRKKMQVILLTGKDGGKLAGRGDFEIRVPHFSYADRIQEIHIKIIHIFIFLIEKKLGY